MKKLLFLILCPFFLFGQTQIGQDLYGEFGLLESLYGYSVDISDDGNTVIIGSPLSFNEENIKSGKVEIYHKNNDTWEKIGNTLYGKDNSDFFGISVSISSDGNIIAIGASNYDTDKINQGLIRTYKNESNDWVQVGDDLLGDNAYDSFGRGVELSSNGNVLLAIAPENDDNGSSIGQVKIFNNINGSWRQKGNSLHGTSAYSSSGFNATISSDGNTVAIGIPVHRITEDIIGKVFVFKYTDGVWYDDDFRVDSSFNTGIFFGSNLKLSSDGSSLIISKPSKVDNIFPYVRVYNNKQGYWKGYNPIFGISNTDYFGSSLAISSDGLKIAIGSATNDTSNGDKNTGYVQFFELDNSNNWNKINNTIFGKSEGSYFGKSLSVTPNFTNTVIGSPYNRDNGYNSGLVSVYENNQDNWNQIGTDLIGDKGRKNDSFGESVSLSPDGNFLFVGSPDFDLSRGRIQIFENKDSNWIHTGTDIIGNNNFDRFGDNIKTSKDGNFLAIGAPTISINDSNSSYIKVFNKQNNIWIQIGDDIVGDDKLNYFASDFHLSDNGEILALKYTSQILFYKLINSQWVNISEIKIDTNTNDNNYLSGFSLLNDGKQVLVKVRSYIDNKFISSILLYEYKNNEWTIKNEVFKKEIVNFDSSISEIKTSGDYVTFDFYNDGIYSVFTYQYKDGEWNQYGNEILGESGDFYFGRELDISSDGLLITILSLNSTKVYKLVDNNWIKIEDDIDFRSSFSIASDNKNIIAFGNPFNDINGINSGIVKVFDFSKETLSNANYFEKDSFTIYPNPASKKITIWLNNSVLKTVNIYNNLGQKVLSKKSKEISVENLNIGIYFLEVETNKGKATKKIVIE